MTRTRNTPTTTELDILMMGAGGESVSEKMARFEAQASAHPQAGSRRRIGAMLHKVARWIEGSRSAPVSLG